MDTSVLLEWSGAVFGLLGAFLIATNTPLSRLGWALMLPSNLAMVLFAAWLEREGMLLLQLGFLATTCLGLYRSGLCAKDGWRQMFHRARARSAV